MKGLSLLLLLPASLMIPGIIGQTRARLAGRKSPGLFQPLADVIKLFKKGSVYSKTTTLIFQISPVVYFSTILTALLFIPAGQLKSLFAFDCDFVYFSYILALGKLIMILGALDTGSGFEGMGANREALYSMLIEPAFFILMGSLALVTGHTSFSDIFSNFYFHGFLTWLIGALSIYLMFQIAMIENSRLLIDDPKTHLELTMVHEVMVLDNSGFDLALIHISTWIKFGIFSALIINLLLVPRLSLIIQILFYFAASMLFAIIVGAMESFRARNKLAVNPAWILLFTPISLVIFLAVVFLVSN